MEPTSKRRRKQKVDVDGGSWFAMPVAVMDSAAYLGLSDAAKALLFEVARQYHGNDNGRMLLSRKHLATRGILSADRIQKAKAELLDAGLIFQTVLGQRPNKAAWYACTWWQLDKLSGYDAGTMQAFERGAYRLTQAKPKRAAPNCARPKKNATLVPAPGTTEAAIVPAPGTTEAPTVPAAGAMRCDLRIPPVPVAGNPLDKPSALSRRSTKSGRQRDTHRLFGSELLPRMVCLANCSECRALVGEVHRSGCLDEPCPKCGIARRLKCACGGVSPTKRAARAAA